MEAEYVYLATPQQLRVWRENYKTHSRTLRDDRHAVEIQVRGTGPDEALTEAKRLVGFHTLIDYPNHLKSASDKRTADSHDIHLVSVRHIPQPPQPRQPRIPLRGRL